MIQKTETHENAANSKKDVFTSQNRKRMQIMSMELEKHLSSSIFNY